MRAFIEESLICCSASAESEVSEAIVSFCDLLEILRRNGERVSRCAGIETKIIWRNYTLMRLLYEPTFLSKNVKARLVQAFNRCIIWQNAEVTSDSEFEVCDQKLYSRTLSYIFRSDLRLAFCMASLGLPFAPGLHLVTEANSTKQLRLQFLSKSIDVIQHFRNRILYETRDLVEIPELMSAAFPSLIFCSQVFGQCKDLGFSHNELIPLLVQHLAAINDYFDNSYRISNFNPATTASRVKASTGVDMSPESNNTRRNAEAMKERRVILEGHIVSCEWHTKLSPTHGRIHFAPSQPNMFNGRIVIGIFARHLST